MAGAAAVSAHKSRVSVAVRSSYLTGLTKGAKEDCSPKDSPGRLAAAWVDGILRDGVLLLSVYLWDGEVLPQRNMAILFAAGASAPQPPADAPVDPDASLEAFGNGKCYKCEGEGHRQADCPSRPEVQIACNSAADGGIVQQSVRARGKVKAVTRRQEVTRRGKEEERREEEVKCWWQRW